ncbi:MAG TPA: Fur family transcriptional regulator [Patescibacteria group bacterium]|nr:Fur family transcriptional regulator [Patescibacteria group bacterium]
MQLQTLFKEIQSHDIRLTKGKKAVLECLYKAKCGLSAQEIHGELSDSALDLATIYRNLETLEKLGFLLKTEYSAKGAKYALSSRKHSHSIECVECGQEVSLGECALQELMKTIQQKTGFNNISHVVKFSGNCPQCQPTEKTA